VQPLEVEGDLGAGILGYSVVVLGRSLEKMKKGRDGGMEGGREGGWEDIGMNMAGLTSGGNTSQAG
jgi:hypothetical protein